MSLEQVLNISDDKYQISIQIAANFILNTLNFSYSFI